jgi:hypothetical protein
MRGGARVDSPRYPANRGCVWVQGVCVGWLRVSDDLSYWLVGLSKIFQMRKEQLGSVDLQPAERSARLCGVITNATFNKGRECRQLWIESPLDGLRDALQVQCGAHSCSAECRAVLLAVKL